MYHFLRTVTEKIYPNAFDSTRKIDPEKEQIIDFCPRCGEQLADKKVVTLRKHEKEKHPITDKEMIFRFYSRGSATMILLLVAVGLAMLILFTYGAIDDMIWKNTLSTEEKELIGFCSTLFENIPQMPFPFSSDMDAYNLKKENYVLSNLDSFKKCNYSVTYYPLGDDKEMIDKFRKSQQQEEQ